MSTEHIGGIILCGGKSTRMGAAKATLPFGAELMLNRITRIVSDAVQPVVVVAAADQVLPPIPEHVLVARDIHESLGPLAGIFAGLTAISPHADAAFITSCDVPLLKPEFIHYMASQLGDNEIAVPVEGKFVHPLAGVFRVGLLSRVETLLREKRLRLACLLEDSKTREVPVDELRAFDPQLESLRNVNSPEDYAQALAIAGFSS